MQIFGRIFEIEGRGGVVDIVEAERRENPSVLLCVLWTQPSGAAGGLCAVRRFLNTFVAARDEE